MATVEKFEDLEIWQLSRELYRKISTIASRLRSAKEFRFADQMKAAAGSIMDNIAEGFERNSRLEFLNSLGIAKGECGEVKSQVYRAFDDGHVKEIEFSDVCDIVDLEAKKIAAFMRYLNRSAVRGLKFKGRA